MNYYALIPLTAFILNLFVWTLIFAGKKSRLNSSFLIFAGITMVWELGSFVRWSEGNTPFTEFLTRIIAPVILLMGFTFLNLIYVLIERKKDLLYYLFLLISPLSGLLASCSDIFMRGFITRNWGVLLLPGSLFLPIITVTTFLPVLYSSFLLLRSIRVCKIISMKRALEVLLTGVAAIILLGIFFNVLLPYGFDMTDIPPLGSSVTAVFSFVMYLSLKKYDLLNIEIEDLALDVLDNINDGVIIKRGDNKIVQFNKAAAEMLNLGLEPQGQCHEYAQFSALTGNISDHVIECKDGRILSLSQSLIGEKGRKKGMVVLLRDITNQKTAENILKSSNEKLDQEVKTRLTELEGARSYSESIFHSIPVCIVILDVKGRIRKVNALFFDLLGYEESELLGASILRIVPPEHHHDLKELLVKMGTGSKVRQELEVRGKGGLVFPVLINVTFMSTGSGDPVIVASLLDIRERKEAEEKLKLSEMQFRTFIDQANDFILIKDRGGRYLKLNRKFCTLIGHKEEEISGKLPEELGYSSEFINNVRKIDERIINNKDMVIVEHRAGKSKDLNIEWLEQTNFPILDEKGEVKYIGVISRDITSAKRYAKELSDKNLQLEAAYGKLQESYEMILKQDKLASLGTMIAGIAHEINNPAQAIRFSMQGLKMNVIDIKECLIELSSRDQEMMQEMMGKYEIDLAVEELESLALENEKSLDKIDRIVNSTKRMAYAESEFTVCDINKVISDSIILVQNQLKKHAGIITSLGENLPCFNGLEQEMGQVLINLLVNAKDAVAEKWLNRKDGVVEILSTFLENEKMIQVTIRDNGTGIPEQNLHNIFDPFFTTKSIGKGTGLGLNICYRIISAHEGFIDVKTELGKGTEFILKIPVCRNDG